MKAATITELESVLERHGTGLTPVDFIAELDAALAGLPSAGASPLSSDEVAFLRTNAGTRAAQVLDSWDPTAESRRDADAAIGRLARDASASMSVAQAATTLGVDRSRISHRLAQGTLWAFAMGRALRVPRWQFTAEGSLLPGLPVIVAAIPEGLAPPIIEAFMRAPLLELGGAAPVDHLAAGGSPIPVAQFLAALGEW
ncbi:MAG: hypothetical protein LBK95_03535 [Bifidobacteriaceae bacterium]|jgi:hypothetical protein|nr:hypothetical protein [Bifidobacteriaceae bacterium]